MMILVVCKLSSTDVIRMNRLNNRGDWDNCYKTIRIIGMVRLSRATWMTKAIGETRITRVRR